MSLLDDVLDRLNGLAPDEREAVVNLARQATKDMKFVPLPGPQTEAYLSEADVLLYGGQAAGGKGLALDTLLPCPAGFIRMGDVKTGDVLYDQDGNQTTVIGTSGVNHRPCFEIEFDDGNTVIADDEHRWLTLTKREREQLLTLTPEWRERRRQSRPSRAVDVSQKPWVSLSIAQINRDRVHEYRLPPVPSIRNTEEIYRTQRIGSRVNHSIEMCGAIDGPALDLPVEPYLFGLWLGDGFTSSGKIGMLQEDWAERARQVATPVVSVKKGVGPLGKRVFEVRRFLGLQSTLRRMGVLGGKHIPTAYLRASYRQRLALFQGLMDTDGTCGKDAKCEIALSNRRLAEDVAELASSLGIKVRLTTRQLSRKSENWADSHRIMFKPSVNVFRLSRKAERLAGCVQNVRAARRYIKAVRSVETVPTKCISVDSPTKTYLIGRAFIPTHNTFLSVGLAQDHKRSIIFRRESAQTDGLEAAGKEIYGQAGFNGTDKEWNWPDGRSLKLAGMQLAGDWNKHAGRERDLIVYDEAGEFLREQVASLLAWNRGPEGQRARVVLASNPPRSADGYWMQEWFAPWLDVNHPRRAEPGELRWAIMEDGSPIWIDGTNDKPEGFEAREALSFTFIPAALSDNPYRDTPEYRAKIDSLPEPLRSQLKYGDFAAGVQDELNQCIPTEWVKEAQRRWKPQPRLGVPMCAIGVDVAQGGTDKTVIASRYDDWFAPLLDIPGAQTPGGADVAGAVLSKRLDGAKVIVDLGGGWGGDALRHLTSNIGAEHAVGYMGVKESVRRTRDNQLRFANIRTEAYWLLREALDPTQPGGATMELPDDKELLADLTAPTFETKSGKGGMVIHLEPKDKLVKRLGRSPDKGDAVVMCWWAGARAVTDATQWRADAAARRPALSHAPRVILGRAAIGRRR